ncbi:hypothetical protein [Aeromicrobium chenweiae]|uniref:Uncharacterized protein n=1 Tax=Aeromicrobium chenweiae TaxID=2079793 RepID=A0A2S0WR35_9ACTN|nr:hypothetical protein [Aeromicrobium chenweiae]AWB93772.1 hypothetical protein C3E78_17000 [Aeromicrobium chenweiae]TGN30815.1 hypothetical protein E4L97_14415 [Aeromicrobium chenweiae]
MDGWLDVGALLKVLVFGIVAGAGLPTLFAAGVRAQAVGAGTVRGQHLAGDRRPLVTAVAYLCFATVAAAVVLGVLFVARDFIGHHTGWYVLGAEEK